MAIRKKLKEFPLSLFLWMQGQNGFLLRQLAVVPDIYGISPVFELFPLPVLLPEAVFLSAPFSVYL